MNPRRTPYRHGRLIGYPERKSWFMAQQFCHGTNLASIMNARQLGEARAVCDEMDGNGHCWLGLRRPFGTWLDGKPIIYEHCQPGGVERKGAHTKPLYSAELPKAGGKWHAQLCSVFRTFIWASAKAYCARTYNTDLEGSTSARASSSACSALNRRGGCCDD